VDTKKYKYKGNVQRGILIMDHVLIYGYMCIGLVGFSLLGMIKEVAQCPSEVSVVR
jgi:hypothetical protein